MFKGWRGALFFVTSAAFSLVSIVLIVAGKGNAKLVGLEGLLFFGGAALGLAGGELARRRGPEMSNAIANVPPGRNVLALVFRATRGQLIGTLLLGACWAGGATIHAQLNPGLPAVFAIGLWLVVLLVAPRLRRQPLTLALTSEGILQSGYGSELWIPWNAIRSAGYFTMYQQPYLGITVEDKDAVVQTGAGQRLGWLNRPIIGYDYSIMVGRFREEPEIVAGIIQQVLVNEVDRARLGTGEPGRLVGGVLQK